MKYLYNKVERKYVGKIIHISKNFILAESKTGWGYETHEEDYREFNLDKNKKYYFYFNSNEKFIIVNKNMEIE